MRKLFLLAAIIAMVAPSAFSQQQDRCSTTEVMENLLQNNPGYEEQLRQLEAFTQEWVKNNPNGTRSVITIPVVVHVVHNTASENITDAQVQTQIDVLNEDFRRLNPDVGETPAAWLGVAADCEIEFCLAARDPAGNPTNGITHTSTTKTSFSTNDNVKFTAQGGIDIWDRNKYLNIWCCDLSGGTIGYAQFPGGPANTDGVVCDYFYFGREGSAHAPYDLGRTATHEVGHWLNLRHIWGDDGTSCSGSDLVDDTPNQADQTFGCPLPTIRISCTNGPNGDMYPNYMDYTDDGCMNIFTLGQKARMLAVFAPGASRDDIITSDGCVPPGGFCTDVWEPNNTKGAAKLISLDTDINGLLDISTDKDFFKFSNTVSEPNIQVTLSDLPSNYNLDLYDPSGVKIVASKNGGTNDEVIAYNTAVIGTYKVRVYLANNGVANATDCYTMVAEIGSSPFRTGEITEAVNLGGEMTKLYPNPSNGNMVVEYNSISNSSVQLIAYDMLGKIIFSEQTYANEGSNSYSVNINSVTSGIYVFEIRNGNETSRMMFSIDK